MLQEQHARQMAVLQEQVAALADRGGSFHHVTRLVPCVCLSNNLVFVVCVQTTSRNSSGWRALSLATCLAGSQAHRTRNRRS